MPSSRTLSKACLSASRLPNRLSLSLQNPTLGISAARSISSSPQIGSSSIMGTVDTFATLAFASQSSEWHGCSNSSMPEGSRDEAKRLASASTYARLASIRIVARPAMACWIVLTRLASASASLPTLILKVRKPSLSRRSTSSSISFGVELLNGVRSGNFTSRSIRRSGWSSSISIAVSKAVAATLLVSRLAAIIAFACTVSLPTAATACSRQNSQPPSRVSLLEPGEICPSPQPIRPSASRASTMIGSNSVKVR